MNGLSLFFMDVWTFAFSQVGIFALGVLAGHFLLSKVMSEIKNLADKIDGKVK
jgi:hypothetical protein